MYDNHMPISSDVSVLREVAEMIIPCRPLMLPGGVRCWCLASDISIVTVHRIGMLWTTSSTASTATIIL